MLLILFLISNVFTIGCLSNHTDEINHYYLVKSEIDKKILDMGLDQQTAGEYRKSLSNDPIGIDFIQTEKCLGIYEEDPPTNSDFNSSFTYPFIGAMAGAVLVILGTERIQHRRIINHGKNAIKNELVRIETILRTKSEYPINGSNKKFRFAPFDISTTAFDSVVSSGSFLHFSTELQNRLVVLYFHIKQHNELLQELKDITIKAQTENVLPTTENVIIRTYERVVLNENRILERYLVRANLLLSS